LTEEEKDPSKLLKLKGIGANILIYAACAHDEVATENVFTDLLKGQKPDERTFYVLEQLAYPERYLTEEEKAKYHSLDAKGKEKFKFEKQEIGVDQHLTYGIAIIYGE